MRVGGVLGVLQAEMTLAVGARDAGGVVMIHLAVAVLGGGAVLRRRIGDW